VANPTKPKAISDILLRNREKLIEFLTSFHTDRRLLMIWIIRLFFLTRFLC